MLQLLVEAWHLKNHYLITLQPIKSKIQENTKKFFKIKANTDIQNKRALETGFYFRLGMVPFLVSFLTCPLGGDLHSLITLVPARKGCLSSEESCFLPPSALACETQVSLALGTHPNLASAANLINVPGNPSSQRGRRC